MQDKLKRSVCKEEHSISVNGVGKMIPSRTEERNGCERISEVVRAEIVNLQSAVAEKNQMEVEVKEAL